MTKKPLVPLMLPVLFKVLFYIFTSIHLQDFIAILFSDQAILQSKFKILLSDMSCLPSRVLGEKKVHFFLKNCDPDSRTMVVLEGKNLY